MPQRFFLGLVACGVISHALRFGGVDDFSVDAAPATTSRTMPERFFFGLVTRRIVLHALFFGGVDDLPVNAAPTTTRPTTRILERFLFRWVTLSAPLLADLRSGVNHLSFNAAPAARRRRTMLECFFFGRPAGDFFPGVDRMRSIVFALICWSPNDLSVNAAPTTSWRRWRRRWRDISWRRWWRRRWAYRRRTTRTTRQRPIPARRRLRRTRRVFSRRSTPFVTTAARFPTPAVTVLFPNPLATVVMPLAARDLHRRKSEGVLVAVFGKTIADDHARIADRSGNHQDFELGRAEIAQHVEVVHFVADIKKSVFGIIAGQRRTDDHAAGIHAVADDAGGGGCVTAQCSEIGNSESRWLSARRAEGDD
jgi:hypothetical protein